MAPFGGRHSSRVNAKGEELWQDIRHRGAIPDIHKGIFDSATATFCPFYYHFYYPMWGAPKNKTPCSMSATGLPRFNKSFMWLWWLVYYKDNGLWLWSYLSLIQNHHITHMHALVAANTGKLHRPCQPRCDTKHDNVCNLLGAVLPALSFTIPSFASGVFAALYCKSAAKRRVKHLQFALHIN